MTAPTSLRSVLDAVGPLTEAFRAAGHRLYLVGGIVRDDLLDRPSETVRDIDLTTDARPEVIKALVAPLADVVWTQGERFGTIGARIDGQMFEITTHRADRYQPDSRKPEVDFSDRIEADLSRRDFTVNAMARSLPGAALVDPFGGAGDLAAKILRTPIDPALSFSDDPLRMVRAARFAATHGFAVADEVREAITAMSDRLGIVAIERVHDEVVRLLAAPGAAAGLAVAVETGLIEQFWPGFDGDRLSRLEGTPDDSAVRVAVLCHPDDPRPVTTGLRMANSETALVERLARAAAVFDGVDAPDRPTLRRFVVVAGPALEQALAVVRAVRPDGARLAAAVVDLIAEEGAEITVPLGGAEVMDLLGLEPGAAVGEALDQLMALRLAEGPLTADEAREALLVWWSGRGAGSP